MKRNLHEQLSDIRKHWLRMFQLSSPENAKLLETLKQEYAKVENEPLVDDELEFIFYSCDEEASAEENVIAIRNRISLYLFVLLLYKQLQEQPLKVYGEILPVREVNASCWYLGELPRINFGVNENTAWISFNSKCCSYDTYTAAATTLFNSKLTYVLFGAYDTSNCFTFKCQFNKFTRQRLVSDIELTFSKKEIFK